VGDSWIEDNIYFCFISQAILDVVVNLQFSLIEKLWQTFWRYSPSAPPDGTTITEPRSVNVSLRLLLLMIIQYKCQIKKTVLVLPAE